MKRNLFLLTCCQAIGQSANTMMFTATALSVVTFYRDHGFATLPITAQHIGVMIWVFPAALLMQRQGRRFGFRVGSIFGIAGASTCAVGLYLASLALMCVGGLILGYAIACIQMYRFAAVELAPPDDRAKAISWVTAGGVVAGVLGQAGVQWSYDKLVPFYMGTYLAMVCVHAIVLVLMGFIEFPPMRPAREVETSEPARPLWQIISQPSYAAAVIAGMIAYGTMAFLMSASPLAIVACGLPHAEAHLVIFLHVMGMFVPSFFTGNLIHRFGVVNVMLAGSVLLLAGVATALSGTAAWNFRIALTLNGIGWNFVFVGATTLVTTCYRPSERGKAQALNDFLIFGTTALATFLAGMLHDRLGWPLVNQASLILIPGALLAVFWLRMQRRQAASAA